MCNSNAPPKIPCNIARTHLQSFGIDEPDAAPWLGLHYKHEFLLHYRHELLEQEGKYMPRHAAHWVTFKGALRRTRKLFFLRKREM